MPVKNFENWSVFDEILTETWCLFYVATSLSTVIEFVFCVYDVFCLYCYNLLSVNKRLVADFLPPYTGWAKKNKPAYFCNNFVYYHPICILFGTCTL